MNRTVLTALPLCISAHAFGQVLPTVIFSEIAASSTSTVPGYALMFDSFSRPYTNSDGSSWVMRASSNDATSADDVLIIGSGMTGAVVLKEGDQAPWALSGELIGIPDEHVTINSSGHYIFGQNLGGSAPTTADEQIVMFDGTNFVVVATEGDAVPGIAGESYGTALNSGSLTDADVAGFLAPATSGGLATNMDDFLILNNAVLVQGGVDVPTGAAEPYETFNTDDFYVSGDGAHWFVNCVLDSAVTTNDNVVVVDGAVVVREDDTLAPFGEPVETIVEAFMNANGDWFVRGDVDSQADWVIYNGAVVAKTGDAIPGGLSGETFSDAAFAACFFAMTGDGNGNYIVGGTTSNADPEADAVLVHSTLGVVARQGDAVDLDGNGVLDDDAFIDTFNNDDLFLTPDGRLYFTAVLYDSAQTDLGQAYIVMQLGAAPCYADCDGSGALNIFDYICFGNEYAAGNAYADCDGSGSLNIFDYICFGNEYAAGCP